ncbi:MAG: ATP-dependent DNA helicase RecG [Clostridia bacterium]|nr:ATP-dependent DNA helicase RecG [Clostridia bacterium]
MNGENEYLLKDIKFIKGVGEAKAKLLSRLCIHTLFDMLWFFPRFVENRSEIKSVRNLIDGETACITGEIYSPVKTAYVKNNMKIYSVLVRDKSDIATIKWFNNKYVKDAFEIGETYNFYGKVTKTLGYTEMVNPTYEKSHRNLHTGRVVPVYSLTENLPQKTIRTIAKNCVDLCCGQIKEYLPLWVRKKYNLEEINHAISSIHFPEDLNSWNNAKKRLSFEELLFMQLGLMSIHSFSKSGFAPVISCKEHFKEFEKKLTFALTNAQKKTLKEIFEDISSGIGMRRLVQGDVGSGKTVVAFGAMYCGVKNGFQTALMVPTSVLASQHYESALKFFDKNEVVLLTGSVRSKEKKEILSLIQNGQAKVIIGTHALLEDNVSFNNLGLIVTDEQHRFGVNQRVSLAKKGNTPHVLVMSATPIPRTLALILYGDLDISVIDELPPGRTPVSTLSVGEDKRQRVNSFIEKEVEMGHQVFIVCPLATASEKIDLDSAEELYIKLKEKVFPNRRVALIHGKMKANAKNEIMESFSKGEIDILISTTVIEVGINVPNASLMIIENAQRFGLSTLHQLRGRVGRGNTQSYCVLISSGGGDITAQRIKTMCETNDGFKIANKDLELRGPGDLLGIKQHGLPDLRIANLLEDREILKNANECAKEILEKDPYLANEENKFLRKKVNEMFKNGVENAVL